MIRKTIFFTIFTATAVLAISSSPPLPAVGSELHHHTPDAITQHNDAHDHSPVPLLDNADDSPQVSWEPPFCEAAKGNDEPIAVGDLVDVKILTKTALGHWQGTGRWQTARVSGRGSDGRYHLQGEDGTKVQP